MAKLSAICRSFRGLFVINIIRVSTRIVFGYFFRYSYYAIRRVKDSISVFPFPLSLSLLSSFLSFQFLSINKTKIDSAYSRDTDLRGRRLIAIGWIFLHYIEAMRRRDIYQSRGINRRIDD